MSNAIFVIYLFYKMMTQPCKLFFVVACFLCACGNTYGQFLKPLTYKNGKPVPFASLLTDTAGKNIHYARITKANQLVSTDQKINSTTGSCNTSTFYMRIAAAAGEKIDLKELQTLPGGDFIAAGNTTLATGENYGLIMRLNNSGAVIFQQKLEVNLKPVIIFTMKVTPDGEVLISGILKDGSNQVFILKLKSDFSTDWVRLLQMKSAPLKTALEFYKDYGEVDHIFLATQLSSSIICWSITLNNTITWNQEIVINGMTELTGISNFGKLELTTNVLNGGKQMSQVTELNTEDGTLLSTAILGDGVEENKCFRSTGFNGRLSILGVRKSAALGFQLVQNTIFSPATVETQHLYKIPGNIDFNISGAFDNAGDAMGYCLPQDGKMIFIKQFNSSQSTPEYTREYTVPLGASVVSVSRSFDGGYLFGLNTKDSGQIILIKTDSIGVLAGCGYSDIANNFIENYNVNNFTATINESSISVTGMDAVASFNNIKLPVVFNCNQNYCPPAPVEDSCLSTYFKIFRSNSYADDFLEWYLMRNNNQLTTTVRFDRILESGNQLTYGLKLFDEKGNFLKGVNVYLDGVSSSLSSRQMDDKTILLNSYSTKNGLPVYTFTLVSDDLKILWSKSVEIPTGEEFGSDGPASEDWLKDEEGNYYFTAINPGYFNSGPKLYIYKMDTLGNGLWLKAYKFDKGYFGTVKMVSTKSSLIFVIDGSNGGSTSVRLDKRNGQVLNSFIYQNAFDGEVYSRMLKFESNQIFYAGNTSDSKILMALFDTTGRPSKLRSINYYPSTPRAANVKNGLLYISFDYPDNNSYSDIILKADSALNIVFANKYPMQQVYRLAKGIGINDNGDIYESGIHFYGPNGNYIDPYIIKYNSNGESGTCTYTASIATTNDIDPQTQNQGYSELTLADFKPLDIPMSFVPDVNGQQVAGIICSSAPQCNFIKLSGPDIICKLNTNYTFKTTKSSLCNLQPLWVYDTTFSLLNTVTDTTAQFSFKKAGSIWLKARLNTGCTFYDDSIQVHIQNAPDSFSLGKDTLLCLGDSLTLHAGVGFNLYTWQDGSKDSLFKVKIPGQYFVHTTNSCGNFYADTILVSSAVIPPLYIGSDTTVCLMDTLQLNAQLGFTVYNWQPQSLIIGQGSSVAVKPLQLQQFTLQATTKEGCVAKDSIMVNVINARPVHLGADTAFCEYDSLTLNAGTSYKAYKWSTGDNTSTITVHAAGNYWLAAQDNNGCFARDTILVSQLYKHPVIDLGPDKDICQGDSLQLYPGSFVHYQWQDGSTLPVYTASKPGIYSVTVIDNNKCTGSDSLQVKSLLPKPADFLPATDSLCQYDKLQITPLRNFTAYAWSTGSSQPSITVDVPGIITLLVQDFNGCSGNDTLQVIQKDCFTGIFIPTAFTPNSDGLNDVFRAKVYGVALSFRLQIYNRFGQLVFTTNDPNKGWDGLFNSQPAETGSFVWQCSYQLQGYKASFKKGTVTLIR